MLYRTISSGSLVSERLRGLLHVRGGKEVILGGLITARLLLLSPSAIAKSATEPSRGFVAVDTSHLMTSPYPYVLENAFPRLNFGDEGPLQLLTAPNDPGHVYVLCRNGEVHRFINDASAQASQVVFDISHKTARDGEEQGLLGFAFHPQYDQTREVFASYATATQ
ncbi:MAG: hypothetical protein ACF788_09030, partial [Novipirellula sp. JB048]